jgi:ubiquinone biosynthesis monooxygenase Coq7
MPKRTFCPMDQLVMAADTALRTIFGSPGSSGRQSPAARILEAELSDSERRHAAGLMRVNHSGEVCAQGLYQGQALAARLPEVRQSMEQAALEENDHLHWCEDRLRELEGRKSLLNPVWYLGSFTLGAVAGLAGDRWSLGFVAETEQQVGAHLDSHLKRLPAQDMKSQAIVRQMRDDELKHATTAIEAGGAKLPLPVRLAMTASARLMTTTAYYI